MSGRMMASLEVMILVLGLLGSLMGARAVQKEYTETYRSQGFTLGPGDVVDKYFPYMRMPQGHIAIKGLFAQVVEEDGTPVPLSELYLHHWVMLRYFVKKGAQNEDYKSDAIEAPNNGVCKRGLSQWFGLGSETRLTNTTVPGPYGIPFGNPSEIPDGYEEMWVLNIHAIDTRDAVNTRGCAECLCKLYNVTKTSDGKLLPEGYLGGLGCCYDQTHCIVKPGSMGPSRTLYMEYTFNWVEMSEDVVPVRVYILDVTDRKSSINEESKCLVEYTVPQCGEEDNNDCIHTAEGYAFLEEGGELVYAVAHQHTGGIGSTLYHEDGSEICTSNPIYGEGSAAGDEAGYIVGMTTCYPESGSVIIGTGEKLLLKSWYSSEEQHTGVMGLFYFLIADNKPRPLLTEDKSHFFTLTMALSVIVIGAAVIAIQLGIVVVRSLTKRSGYEPIV